MASTTATCSPSSLQLRLAMNCRKSPAIILVRSRLKKIDRQVSVLCVAQCWASNRNGNFAERRHNGSSWVGSDSKADTFSGWSRSDNGDDSIESQRKKWFTGFVGAGVAGVVLVAGLTFAALSLNKRNTSRQMGPLTTHQEVLLVSDDNKVGEDVNTGNNVEKDDGSLESKTGTDKHLSSSPEINEAPRENKLGNDDEASSVNHIKYATSGSDASNNVSVHYDLLDESAPNDMSVASDIIPRSPQLHEPETLSDSFVTSSSKDSDGSLSGTLPEPTSDIEGNLVDVEPVNLSNKKNQNTLFQEGLRGLEETDNSNISLDSSFDSITDAPSQPVGASISDSSQLDTYFEPQINPIDSTEAVGFFTTIKTPEISNKNPVLVDINSMSVGVHNLEESSGTTSVSASAYPLANIQDTNGHITMDIGRSSLESPSSVASFSPTGIPAPSVVSAALQVLPGKVLVPAVVDQVQGQALAALQVLKVIEQDVLPGDLCTRREYARWLVSASSALSRNTVSKVYPAMYIENVTELAFDDITPEDPDFSSIQGLAEAGLISSKLSKRDLLNEDLSSFFFTPERPLSRQDLVSWKMVLERRQLPEADRKSLYQLSGFIDIDKINPDAWPALIADLSSGEQGIIALAFGCTRLFQPNKPVTKAQAAVALATGEASDIVSEELARIEAESIAENAVSTHSALVAQVEEEINASFEKELSRERKKIDAVEKMADEARLEMERLRSEREEENLALMKERAAIESEMELLSRIRHEVQEQLESLITNKAEISYEKEKINKLLQEAERENQEIARLQYELEVERKALSMARAWAEDEAKRASEQAKALEEARDRWERHGIKVVVDNDLCEETNAGVTWLHAGKQFSVDGTVSRAEMLVGKLKVMANDVKGKSREIIDKIIQKILILVLFLKEWASKAGTRAKELKDTTILKARGSVQELQQTSLQLSSDLKEATKRLAGDCREGVEKLTQKFKT
ncbi:hypothetical protein CFOL_v3_22768 [Cephalotus follicularis]|uniref:Uncharacterized protein n=1 Tax=Cephalotus follicularis TaxID=3775 RepID=A0A1Q3CGV2_CEPFO|nr:hypothetical protein CFOL_v3_22768 [Cephalotus follicularis]